MRFDYHEPTSIREAVELGARFGDETMREAGRIAATECRPISDVRATARYRALLVTTLVPRALARCAERIRGGVS